MSAIMTDHPPRARAGSWLRRAELVEIDDLGQRARIRLALDSSATEHWAELAVALPADLEIGSRVLAARDDGGDWVVLGVSRALASKPGVVGRLDLPGGAHAKVATDSGGARLEVISPEGQLVFAYDPISGQTRVRVPDGDLVLEAPRGGVRVEAAERIAMEGAEVNVRGRRAASLGCGAPDRRSGASLSVDGGDVRVRGTRVDVASLRASVHVQEGRSVADRLIGRYGEVDVRARIWRLAADRVVHRLRRLYERVEGLAERTAGRIRMLVDSSWQVRAGRISQRARDDVRIDGRKIDLG